MKLTKAERSWVLYDVANSAFILIITATIPIYFRGLAEAQGVTSQQVTSYWGYATSISVLALALIAPILGAIADYKGMKKRLFVASLTVGILGGLTFTAVNQWLAFLILFIIARLGYSACNVFYDSMLVDVSSDERMDMISSFGYAFGYIGSTIPFIVGIVLILNAEAIGITTVLATQISFLITFLWWALLSLPMLKNVKQKFYLEPKPHIVTDSFKRILITLGKIRQNKRMLYYIIAYFCYIDGVYTIISMATTYGGEVGIGQTEMILALLLTQFVAFPFAILAGMLAKKFGAIKLIKVYILIYMFACVFGYQLDQAWEFWFLAIVIGLAQGGIQSLSRSYYGKLVPKEESSEYFGFFDIFGKFADFLGPIILALAAQFLNSSKYGVLFLIVLFIIGYYFIHKVDKLERAESK
ncbi:MAG TPA: MFS transporter [Erysipelotrichaceae bacterium]|nr:MAG: MFS transporter [Firmicutes bacterium GWE2_51_13]HAM63102.1 MFS transporter [Erysipelotrichaceae bacterium]